jgi:hypothetical protein
VDAVSVAIDDLDVAGSHQPRGGAVVGDAPRHQLVAVIVDLHPALGGDGVAVVVVDERVGLEQKLGVGRDVAAVDVDALRRRHAGQGKRGQRAGQRGRPGQLRDTGASAAHSTLAPH